MCLHGIRHWTLSHWMINFAVSDLAPELMGDSANTSSPFFEG